MAYELFHYVNNEARMTELVYFNQFTQVQDYYRHYFVILELSQADLEAYATLQNTLLSYEESQ